MPAEPGCTQPASARSRSGHQWGYEPVLVRAFIAERHVEALDERILHQGSPSGELELDPAFVRHVRARAPAGSILSNLGENGGSLKQRGLPRFV